MRNRMLTGFIAGVLFSALFMGALFGAYHALDDTVEAQTSHTWQMVEFDDWLAGAAPRAFVEQLPADCDLVPDPHNERAMYYSCPEPFEPNNRPG